MEKKEQVEMFKSELSNLYRWQNKIRKIDGEIEILEYNMENVKGIDYSKQGGTYNAAAAQEKILSMIEKKERLEKLIALAERIRAVGRVLNCMAADDRELVLEIVAEGRPYRAVCEERKINNPSSLYVTINNIIEKAIKKSGY